MFLKSILLIIFVVPCIHCKNCTLTDRTNPTKISLLNRLSVLKGLNFIQSQGNYTYSVSICSDAKGDTATFTNVSVTRVLQKTTNPEILGRNNATDIFGEGGRIILIYGNGSEIKSNENDIFRCNGQPWKSLIMITCEPNNDDNSLKILEEKTSGCFMVFHIETPLICLEPVKFGKFTVFIMLLFTGLICYFLIGVAYKRIILGAKGIEQLPHYKFWINCLTLPLQCMHDRSRSFTNYETQNDERLRSSNSGNIVNGNQDQDEPLLHP